MPVLEYPLTVNPSWPAPNRAAHWTIETLDSRTWYHRLMGWRRYKAIAYGYDKKDKHVVTIGLFGGTCHALSEHEAREEMRKHIREQVAAHRTWRAERDKHLTTYLADAV